MTFKLGLLTVSIYAKGVAKKKNFNSHDTKAYANELSIVYDYAAELMKLKGYTAIANEYKRKAHEIYKGLSFLGYYDDTI